MALATNDTVNDDKAFLNLPCHKQFILDSVPNSIIFSRMASYLSMQMGAIETQNSKLRDKNLLSMECFMNGLDASGETNFGLVNTDYRVTRMTFKGKNMCEADCLMSNMNITIKYRVPTILASRVKHDIPENDSSVILEYTIKSSSKTPDKAVISEHDLSVYSKICIHPKNKLSFKYFNVFISGVMAYMRKLDKKQHNGGELTVYINIDSYWEELFTRPSRNIDSVYLPKEEKEKVIKELDWFLDTRTRERYERLGRNYKRVLLFEGVPGSGKTSFALAIASKYGYDLAMLSFTDKVTDGTFTRLMRQLPEKTILLLEDIDCLFHNRKNEDTQKNFVTFSGILNALDGIATPHEFICIITTNYKNMLDDALLRPGRIDSITTFDYVRKEQLKQLYKAYMEKVYSNEDFKEFYKAYCDLNVKCPVSLIQEYLFMYLDNPKGALENINEIKELREKSTKKEAEVYM